MSTQFPHGNTLKRNGLTTPVLRGLGLLLIAGLYVLQFSSDGEPAKFTGILLVLWLPFLYLAPSHNWRRAEKVFVGLCGFYFLSTLPAYAISIDVNKANGELEKLAKWAVLPAVLFFILRRLQIRDQVFSAMVMVGVSFLFAATIYSAIDDPNNRITIYGNPNIAGYLAAGSIALLAGLYPSIKYKPVVITVILMAVFALLWSQTRGAWLTLPIIALCFSRPLWHQFQALSLRTRYITAGGLIALIVGLALMPFIQHRILQTLTNFTAYVESPEQFGRSSLGVRLELFRAGWLMALNYPLTGIGLGDVKYYIVEYDRFMHIIPEISYSFSMHSEYFQALAFRGFVNLTSFLIMLAWLTGYYLRSLPSDSAAVTSYRTAGLAVTLTTAVVCLTLSMLSNNTGINFFIFSQALLIFMIERQRAPISSPCYAHSKNLH
ncbi:Uncharacterised protein [BD1-7 clade bacterium]|uniref:O-antigen ligase-related domain-containing protein n=1 Tax=BD1-7 clade bacterium TaxID=2029982 RepID=A0A5S9N5X8_9GAMM|nr:Uncharacterised protein [BD1-7 clade bacterium]CAA0084252.1 Uncharacterised protein [BD1-7 clade bacterium]